MFSGLSARSDEDLAIWIEGAREDELPERVLGAVRLRRISPKCLTKLTKLTVRSIDLFSELLYVVY